ncbi:White collar 1 protein [Sphaceloma murrayae]|uniref:White collar 1 protein n=1 Tax=Sphaceloma murrayae TaxID=2082308 RepID=A0A2K1R3G7_9PEZI|nr:White collar 1 protein [Sphaceloma murrayae]
MSNYDPFQFDDSDVQNMSHNRPNSMINNVNGMNSPAMMQGQSLDDIVDQNAKMMRRQSMPQSFHRRNTGDMSNMQNMMEFSSGTPAGPLENFHFDPATSLEQDNSGNLVPRIQQPTRSALKKQQSGPNLSGMGSPYNPQLNSAYSSLYQSPAHGGGNVDMDINSPYVNQPMGLQMDFSDSGLTPMNSTGANQMSMYSNPSPYQTSMMNSPMNVASMTSSIHGPSQNDPGGGGNSTHDGRRSTYGGNSIRRNSMESSQQRLQSRSQSIPMPTQPPRSQYSQTSHPSQQSAHSQPSPAHVIAQHEHNPQFTAQPQNPKRGSQQDKGMGDRSMSSLPDNFDPSKHNPNNQNFPWEVPEGGWPSTMINRPHMQSVYKNAYSSTGFDMLGVLMRVATRPKPEINLGSVDLSCAFVVCDAEKDDFPIIYCSDNFERLTGYTRHMILGRNCRFLQSPDGNVAPGIKRKYVDDDSVLYLKNMINARREAQISLINYRRGGQPFMNLLTMIPINWDTDQVKFFVGFQVDLVEQPNAVTNKNPDGSYTVNYQRGMAMPRYVMNAPESTSRAELGQTIPRDDVSAILSTIGSGESEYAKRMWDKVLLENTDDVVHVLSLKGLFQWVSPSALRVLEYEPGELIGTALSSVCHPSDIVPVTRELKDTSTGAAVNVVFRIRRKNSGYMWFEGHGSLHTEQGKGRKSIIMVGRERPVYALSKNDLTTNGGIGEYELWTKMSTSGMFLFVSSNVRQLLDRQPEELVGISIQSLMRSDSKQDFGRILEHARTGKKASIKHEMINRRGQVLQAFTTLYPGDATEGSKPTFIVAQTRLIKYSRNSSGKPPGLIKDKSMSESGQLGTPNNLLALQSGSQAGGSTPSRTPHYVTTDTSAATYAGQHGLQIGKQDITLASEDNLFEELKTTKSSSWQYEIRQLEKRNRLLAEEVQTLLAAKKKRKRRKGAGMQQKDCANCHTRVTPEWRRGPSGQRDLCNSCGLRWAKLNGRVSPRTSSQHSKHSGDAASDKASKASASPRGSIVKNENGQIVGGIPQASIGGTLAGGAAGGQQAQASPTQGRGESHASHMEGAEGVPEKIEEGVEPD